MKKVLKILGILLAVVVLVCVGLVAWVYIGLSGIPESHTEGNVPTEENFDIFLTRDLKTYFSTRYEEEISVSYEFLRDNPTQVGVAAPKFYLWATITSVDTGELVDEGVIRVGTNAKESFIVTDYVPASKIKDASTKIEAIFPSDVVEAILTKV